MSNIPRWGAALLLLLGLAQQLDSSMATGPSSFAPGNAWQRALFGRDSRNMMHRRARLPAAGDGGRLNDYLGSFGAMEQQEPRALREEHQPLPQPQQVSE